MDNRQYLYDHLPARFRRDDAGLLLKRILTFWGETLDSWETLLETFNLNIAPATASIAYIKWWLYALFDWSYYPSWFTLADYRTLYQNFATHLMRRGTAPGIVEFLRDFGITARVVTREAWGQQVWGEHSWAVSGPLGFVVQIISIREANNPANMTAWGQGVWGAAHYTPTTPAYSRADIENLVQYQIPHGQVAVVEYALPKRVPLRPAHDIQPRTMPDWTGFQLDFSQSHNSGHLISFGV